MSEDLLAQITTATDEGNSDVTINLTKQALEAGLGPKVIINQGLVRGMRNAGDKFARGEYFLPHLLIAAKCMQGAMEILEPELFALGEEVESAGTIVVGTVQGDIHAIGKTLVGTMLSANGFQVHDLGVDVSIERFVEKVQETNADLLGLSALLTTTMVVQREIIEALDEAGIREHVKVLVGGAPVSQEWADEIGADGYAEDAMASVGVATAIVGKD